MAQQRCANGVSVLRTFSRLRELGAGFYCRSRAAVHVIDPSIRSINVISEGYQMRERVLTERHVHILIITINRPEANKPSILHPRSRCTGRWISTPKMTTS